MKANRLFISIVLYICGCTTTDTKLQKEESSPPLSEQAFAHTTHSLMDISSYTKKVERAVSFYRDNVRNRPNKKKPLILILGSSSTGGMSHQNRHFWPSYLQKKMPNYHIQSLAVGGATTWHIAKILHLVGVKAEFCILYAGHNDRMESAPRQSLAQLEQGLTPQKSGFTTWVTPKELIKNLDTMSNYCGKIFGIDEYVVPNKNPLTNYIQALEQHPNVTYISVSKDLSTEDQKKIMRDKIHFQPYGHERFASLLSEKLQKLGL